MNASRATLLTAIACTAAFLAPVTVAATYSPPPQRRDITLKGITDGQRDWHFEPRVLRVNQGDTLHFTFEAEGAGHGLRIARSQGIDVVAYPGMPAQGTVVVDWVGGREFYCTFDCGPGHAQMSGMIVSAKR
jgi:heme/copper-type cytochrome/quinol oxidase subunit 2